MIATLFGGTGCKKFLNINSDPDTPQEPAVSSVFPAMLAGIPRGVQYDSRYLGKYTQNWLTYGNANGDTHDRHGYVFGSDNMGDIWRQVYYGLGKNLDYIIEKGIKTNQLDYVGASYALKAFMFQHATDYHGEIIFSEAFKEDTYYFKYDTQDKVYAGIDSLCRIAINYLDQAMLGTNTLSISDFTYKGDLAKWKKFTYGLLARNWNNLSNKSFYNPDSVISFANKSLASVDDDFAIPFDATKNDDANFYGPYRNNLTLFRPSNFVVKLLDGTTLAGAQTYANRDPRIAHMLSASQDTTNGNGGYRGVDPGIGDPLSATTTGVNARKRSAVLWGDSLYANPSAASFTANAGKYLFKDKAVMPIMTYAEIQFIKAEAAFRKGDKPTAYTAYRNGINGHFDFINRNYPSLYRSGAVIYNGAAISTAQRNAYLASANVKQDPATLTLTDIMLQKYIALWGWGWVETWTDLRRYHYTDIDPATTMQVYKNFTLPASFFPDNLNKPAYRVRPRYNSEYVWNLDELKRFGGDKADYHTYKMWFSEP
jgi:hypothetical protein